MVTVYNPQKVFTLPGQVYGITSLGNGCGAAVLCNNNNEGQGYVISIDGSNISANFFAPLNGVQTSAQPLIPANFYNTNNFTLFSLMQENNLLQCISYSNTGYITARSDQFISPPPEQEANYIQVSTTEQLSVIGFISVDSSTFFSFDNNNLLGVSYNSTVYSALTSQLIGTAVSEQYFTSVPSKLVLTSADGPTIGIYGMIYSTNQTAPTPLSPLIKISNTTWPVTSYLYPAAALFDGNHIAVAWNTQPLTTSKYYFQVVNSSGNLMFNNEILVPFVNPNQYVINNVYMVGLPNNTVMIVSTQLGQAIIFDQYGEQQGDVFTIESNGFNWLSSLLNAPIYLENNYIMLGTSYYTEAVIFDTGLVVNNRSSGPLPAPSANCSYYQLPAASNYVPALVVKPATEYILPVLTITGNGCYIFTHDHNYNYQVFLINGNFFASGQFTPTGVNSNDGFVGLNSEGNILWLVNDGSSDCPTNSFNQLYLQIYSNNGTLYAGSPIISQGCLRFSILPSFQFPEVYNFLEVQYSLNDANPTYVVFNTSNAQIMGSYSKSIYDVEPNKNVVRIDYFNNGCRLALYVDGEYNLYGEIYDNQTPPNAISGMFSISTSIISTYFDGGSSIYTISINDTTLAIGWWGNFQNGGYSLGYFHQLIDISGRTLLPMEVNLAMINCTNTDLMFTRIDDQNFMIFQNCPPTVSFNVFSVEGQLQGSPFTLPGHMKDFYTPNNVPIPCTDQGFCLIQDYANNEFVFFNVDNSTNVPSPEPQCGIVPSPTSTPIPTSTPSNTPTSTPSATQTFNYTPSVTPSVNPTHDNGEGLSPGAVAGIVIGSVATFGIAVAGLAWCFLYKNHNNVMGDGGHYAEMGSVQ
jgi:hypothetical protein